MQDKSLTISWREGAGADPAVEPAIDTNGLRRIVVAVANAAYPDGYAAYVPDDDTSAAKAALDIWAGEGKPT